MAVRICLSRPLQSCLIFQPANILLADPRSTPNLGIRLSGFPRNVCEGARRSRAVAVRICPSRPIQSCLIFQSGQYPAGRPTKHPNLGNPPQRIPEKCLRGCAAKPSRGSSNLPVPTITVLSYISTGAISCWPDPRSTPCTLGIRLRADPPRNVLRGCAERSRAVAVRICPSRPIQSCLIFQSANILLADPRSTPILESASADSREMSARCAAEPSRGSSNLPVPTITVLSNISTGQYPAGRPTKHPNLGIRLSGFPRNVCEGARRSRAVAVRICPSRPKQSCLIFQSANILLADPRSTPILESASTDSREMSARVRGEAEPWQFESARPDHYRSCLIFQPANILLADPRSTPILESASADSREMSARVRGEAEPWQFESARPDQYSLCLIFQSAMSYWPTHKSPNPGISLGGFSSKPQFTDEAACAANFFGITNSKSGHHAALFCLHLRWARKTQMLSTFLFFNDCPT